MDPRLINITDGFRAMREVRNTTRIAALERGTSGTGGGGGGGAAIHVGDTLTGEVTGTLASPSTTLTINPAGTPQVAGLGVGNALTISTRTGSTSGRSLSRFTIGATTSSRLVWDDTLSGADQDYWSHYFDAIGFGSVEGKRYRIYDGNTTTPVTEYEPTFKISRYQNATGLAAATTSPPLTVAYDPINAGALMSHFSALYVAHGAKSGNETMVTAIVGTAMNVNTGKPNQDALGIWGGGDITGSGSGVGTGGYLEGKRSTATAQALGAELRVNNFANATGHPAVNNTHGMVQLACGGIWITSAGYDSTNTLSFGSSIGLSGGAEPQFVWGYHVSDANIYGTYTPIVESGILAAAFRDDSKSATSLMIGGTHANAAIWIKSVTGAKETGMGFGNTGGGGIPDTWFYRDSAGSLNFAGLSTANRITIGTTPSTQVWNDTVNGTPVQIFLADDLAPAQRYAIEHGTVGASVSTDGPSFRLDRIQNITSLTSTASFFPRYAAMYVVHRGLNTDITNVVGGAFVGTSASTASGGDATGVTGYGQVTGGGVGYGIGAYVEGKRTNTAGSLFGLEVRAANYAPGGSTSHLTYTATGTTSCAVWISANGNADGSSVPYTIGAGAIISNIAGNQFQVGYAVNAETSGATTGPIVETGLAAAAFRDDSNAATSLMINGTHATAGIWIKSTAGTAASGIAFGTGGTSSAPDTFLYRAASSTAVFDFTTVAGGGIGFHAPTTISAVANPFVMQGKPNGTTVTRQSITMSGGGTRGPQMVGSYTITGAVSSAGGFFGFQFLPIITMTGLASSTKQVREMRGFSAAPTITMNAATAHGSVAAAGEPVLMFQSNPTLTAQASTDSATIAQFSHFVVGSSISAVGHTAGAGWTITNWRGLHIQAPSGAVAFGTTYAAIDIEDLNASPFTGTLPALAGTLSLRSKSATHWMSHGGPAIIGATTSIAAVDATAPTLELERATVISGAVTDGYAAGLALDPSYQGAFTVTRHNYLDIQDVALLSSAVVTDACLFRTDAAIGTHKMIDGATTKTSPGTVTAWVKVNLNGTVHYMPAYASKTT